MAEALLQLAAGGTGGHMFPAQALAEEMLARGWRVKLTTDERGARYTQNFPEAVEISVISAGTFARGGLLAKARVPFQILGGVMAARRAMRADKPSAVVGFGGYPALPTMLAAWIMGLPRIIHEQNAILGRVNKFLAKKVDLVACGMWPTELPEGLIGLHVGNPVRGAVAERAGADYISPGDWPMSVLAMGGSQGSSILSQTLAEAMGYIPEDRRANLRIACQTREADLDEVAAKFDAAGVAPELAPFFDDVPSRMAEAQLVISRAGASSVADISVIGRPSILIPLAIATNDHQSANARGLAEAEGAIVIPEAELNAEVLAKCIDRILDNPEGAIHMARAAAELGKPRAAEELADQVMAYAGLAPATAPEEFLE